MPEELAFFYKNLSITRSQRNLYLEKKNDVVYIKTTLGVYRRIMDGPVQK